MAPDSEHSTRAAFDLHPKVITEAGADRRMCHDRVRPAAAPFTQSAATAMAVSADGTLRESADGSAARLRIQILVYCRDQIREVRSLAKTAEIQPGVRRRSPAPPWVENDASAALGVEPSTVIAFEEHLGLKLAEARSVKFLVIDHAEKP